MFDSLCGKAVRTKLRDKNLFFKLIFFVFYNVKDSGFVIFFVAFAFLCQFNVIFPAKKSALRRSFFLLGLILFADFAILSVDQNDYR